MNRKQKEHQSIMPGIGIGAKVVDKDISYAMRIWKQQLKQSNTLTRLKEMQEFKKPSVVRRAEILKAKYLNKFNQEF
jgi:ribosomal protein S21